MNEFLSSDNEIFFFLISKVEKKMLKLKGRFQI